MMRYQVWGPLGQERVICLVFLTATELSASWIIVTIVIILQVNALLETLDLHIERNARAISHCTTVWCLVTPSTMVCSGFTATRFLRSRFMAVTAWTS